RRPSGVLAALHRVLCAGRRAAGRGRPGLVRLGWRRRRPGPHRAGRAARAGQGPPRGQPQREPPSAEPPGRRQQPPRRRPPLPPPHRPRVRSRLSPPPPPPPPRHPPPHPPPPPPPP